MFCNEWVWDLGTYGVPYLVIGARGFPCFVMNECGILAHKVFHI